MTKKTQSDNPFEIYEFDFTNKVAYEFPKKWTNIEKRKFRALTSEQKKKECKDGGGFHKSNGEDLRIMLIPSDLFSVPKRK